MHMHDITLFTFYIMTCILGVNKWDVFQTRRCAYVLWSYLLTKQKHVDDSKTKKATKLPHPNWKICCSKHMNNHKELHTMLHHQQPTIIIVTTWIITKECQKLELLMPSGLH
jgi:hypothetical protein